MGKKNKTVPKGEPKEVAQQEVEIPEEPVTTTLTHQDTEETKAQPTSASQKVQPAHPTPNQDLEEEKENESLKHYQVEFYKEGKFGSVDVVGRQQALIEVDRIMEFGDYDDPSLVIAVRQAKRLVQGFIKGQWIYPEPRDKLLVKSTSQNFTFNLRNSRIYV